ncbi:MAG: WbqC family protein [Tannerella sp.]|jgi:hypothetical protein|nr:WbqC family protein [Tannerella sp.]
MKIGIMQPYYFPYIGYFQLIRAVDRFILYDKVQFVKKGWIHRNRIVQPDGSELYIRVPLLERKHDTPISRIKIDNSGNWRNVVCRQLNYYYRKMPCFEECYPVVESVLQKTFEYLGDLNEESVRAICNLLDIKTSIIGKDYPSIEEELDDYPHKKMENRVLAICRRENADTYVNSIGGQQLYDRDAFAKSGINLLFVKTPDCRYPQRCPQFVPRLSILDTLFCCGREGTKRLLDNYLLI